MVSGIEYFYHDSDMNVLDVLTHLIEPENGMIQPPQRPDHRVELERDALEEFRV
jgi:L-alanine-DL-glutamate epimerase-like enolase superfamily enzyme